MLTVASFGISLVLPYFLISSASVTSALILALIVRVTTSPTRPSSTSAPSIVATTLLWGYVHHNKSIHMISVSFIGLLTAGIMANCHERIVLGYVRDYIHLNFINFPVFNVADVFITIGVIALIGMLLIYKR